MISSIDFIGFVGVGLNLLAYYLNQIKKLKRDSRLYDLLFLLGAFFLLINAAYYKSIALALLEAVFILIGIQHFTMKDILNVSKRKHSEQKKVKKQNKTKRK